MTIIPQNENPLIVSLIASIGVFQSFIDYATPATQFLISFFTVLYVFQKWRNERKKVE